jgi:predicted nucleotidyltransferase
MQADDEYSGKEKGGRMDFDRATLRTAIDGVVSGHPDIAAAYLYGSAARGTATPLSDIDIGLLFRNGDGSFRERLATAVEIGSAIARALSGARVDARDLDELPLAIVGAVLTDGALVVSNDEERRVAFERDTRLRYFDFLPIHLGEVREANATLRRRFLRG